MSVPADPILTPRLTLRQRAFMLAVLLAAIAGVLGLWALANTPRSHAESELTWGHRGRQHGDMIRPRAAAIDRQGRLFIVDFTARIQVYDTDGKYLGPTWYTPDYRDGRPSGLSIDRDGNLLVSDSHYNCVRTYDAQGRELRKFGGEAGTKPGQLGYVSDTVQDEDGFYYVAEFGENHRISKFDSDGKFLTCWGTTGMEPGEFGRIRALELGPDGNLYVADATNHRIQVFTRDGKLVRVWGEPGNEPGQLSYPYDLAFGPKGDLYVVEYGNNRVQKFTLTGESLGCFGSSGKAPGQFLAPWALAIDAQGRLHVLDTENHRVQRFEL